MTFIKIALAVALISGVAYAAGTHGSQRPGHEISQTDQWDVPIAAPFGATGFVDLDIIY